MTSLNVARMAVADIDASPPAPPGATTADTPKGSDDDEDDDDDDDERSSTTPEGKGKERAVTTSVPGSAPISEVSTDVPDGRCPQEVPPAVAAAGGEDDAAETIADFNGAKDKFQEISRADDVLADAEKRAIYDAHGDEEDPSATGEQGPQATTTESASAGSASVACSEDDAAARSAPENSPKKRTAECALEPAAGAAAQQGEGTAAAGDVVEGGAKRPCTSPVGSPDQLARAALDMVIDDAKLHGRTQAGAEAACRINDLEAEVTRLRATHEGYKATAEANAARLDKELAKANTSIWAKFWRFGGGA